MSKTVHLADVTLADKYRADEGRIYLSGIQALVRLLMVQRQRDRVAGLNTAGFVSGYRGSPLGMLDSALWGAVKELADHDVRFSPGLNEDLAATAVWGTQQATLQGRANVDGVFSLWYAKGPGVDRSLDALKHANLAGTSQYGGVLAIAGDDHVSQSSTLAHQSDQTLIAAMIPVLNPASVQEYLDFGVLGYGMSRFAGVWVGFKALAETVESSASIEVQPNRIRLREPQDFEPPPNGLHLRWPDPPLAAEARLHGPKMDAVAAFARANGLDRQTLSPREARLGIITTGKSYLDVRQALSELGFDERRAESLGIRLYKVGMSWPLESTGALAFADGLQRVLVVEEKQGLIEHQLARLLFNLPTHRRPLLAGKTDETGADLLPTTGELTPTLVARAIVASLERLGFADDNVTQRLARLTQFETVVRTAVPAIVRTPFFCSGCPHSTSTRVPDGSRAQAGIGCHGMATLMPDRRTETMTHMGGEGANWIGEAPFSKDRHVFQNLGDGTYAHSGLLAIRAAAAAGVNITFKILYNDAVAMTGGQPVEGQFTVGQISRQMVAEGVSAVVIVTDDLARYRDRSDIAPGCPVHHRDELDAVQKRLRDVPGVTVLIYDQTCAAEKRRRRKRGLMPDPPRRLFINAAVCEGCGDCSVASNCVSVTPLETELGRKRAIDQSSCNKDYSCANGFCPSFVSVEGGSVRKSPPQAQESAPDHMLPEPAMPSLDTPYEILVAGVGGTGVVTVGALLGMAAHLEGRGCTVSDFTGVSQKGGAVTSHVRIANRPDDLHSVRIGAGAAELLLAYDPVVAVGGDVLSRVEEGVTRGLVNSYVAPPGAFVMNPTLDFQHDRMRKSLRSAIGDGRVDFIDATKLATRLLGDGIGANLFLLGFAYQRGLIPVSATALLRAVEINAAAVTMNKAAFGWGRLAAHAPERLPAADVNDPPPDEVALPQLIERRAQLLREYQDEAYAKRYLATVELVKSAERQVDPGSEALTRAVAQSLHKLMAYKDEYEVARLYTDGTFRADLARQFEGSLKLKLSLAPPLFARRDPATGRLRKRLYGPWMFTALSILARLKGLRGTPFDPFGRLADRRLERALIAEYEATVSEIASNLQPANLRAAVALARWPQMVRGYGHVKEASLLKARAEEARLRADFRNACSTSPGEVRAAVTHGV